jgi:hypothetical protein
MKKLTNDPSHEIPHTWRQHILIIMLAFTLISALTVAWSAPYTVSSSESLSIDATHTPAPPPHHRKINTPSPYEIETNRYWTDGILVMGVVIVLIIMVGTVIVLRRKH